MSQLRICLQPQVFLCAKYPVPSATLKADFKSGFNLSSGLSIKHADSSVWTREQEESTAIRPRVISAEPELQLS
jgi:hypothetical protein